MIRFLPRILPVGHFQVTSLVRIDTGLVSNKRMICPDTIHEISRFHRQQQAKRHKIAPFRPSWEKLFHSLHSQEHEALEASAHYRGADSIRGKLFNLA